MINRFALKPTLITYLTTALIIVFAFLTQQISFNSDLVYLPSVFSDVFIAGHDFTSWHFTPAPYFFPDMLVFFSINAIISNVFFAFMIFAILQTWATLFLAGKIAFLVTREKNAIVLTHIIIVLALLFLTSLNEAFHTILINADHFGTIINGLIFTYFLLAYLIQPKTKYVFALFFISLLGAGSDLLFVIQFMFPGIITLFLCKFCKKLTGIPVAKLSFLFLLGGFVGFSVKYFLHIGNGQYHILVHSNGSWSAFLQIFSDLFLTNVLIGLLIAIFYFGVFMQCILTLRTKNEFESCSPIKSLVFFLSLFVLISFLCTVENGIINDSPTMRYFLNLYWLPIIFFWLLFQSCLNKKILNYILIIVLYLIAIIAVSCKAFFHAPYTDEYVPDYLPCIDHHISEYNASHAEKIKYGISTYWEGKLTTTFSKQKIVMSQYDENLHPRLWITTKENYRDQYDFIIFSKNLPLDMHLIEQLNGKPIIKFQCGDDISLLIYGKNGVHVK